MNYVSKVWSTSTSKQGTSCNLKLAIFRYRLFRHTIDVLNNRTTDETVDNTERLFSFTAPDLIRIKGNAANMSISATSLSLIDFVDDVHG